MADPQEGPAQGWKWADETPAASAEPSKGHDFKVLGVNIHVPPEEKPRLDSNMVGWGKGGSGIAPEDALMAGRAVKGVAKAATAGGVLAGAKEAISQASPVVKFEVVRRTLQAAGVPPDLAVVGAFAVSGYKGKAPAASGAVAKEAASLPAEMTGTSFAPAPQPVMTPRPAPPPAPRPVTQTGTSFAPAPQPVMTPRPAPPPAPRPVTQTGTSFAPAPQPPMSVGLSAPSAARPNLTAAMSDIELARSEAAAGRLSPAILQAMERKAAARPGAAPAVAPAQAPVVAPAETATKSPTAAPEPVAAQSAPAVEPQPSSPVKVISRQQTLNELAIAARRNKIQLSAHDYGSLAVKVKDGMAPADAVAAMAQERAALAKAMKDSGAFGNLPDEATMRGAVAKRNTTGQWKTPRADSGAEWEAARKKP